MIKQNYEIRRMTSVEEVRFATNLAGKMNWNPGLHDPECFFAADPKGFFIGFLNGRPISCISAVKYSDSYGFIGLYIVKPEHQRQHYGTQIGTEALKYVDGLDVGLDGVVEMVEEYAKYDFKLAYYNSRYEGQAMGATMKISDPRIIELSRIHFSDLVTYDNDLFPASRPEFLKSWINQPHSIALGILEKDRIAGYAVLRKCLLGYKVGPLFADNEDLAESLLKALSSRIRKGTKIFLDVPGEIENPAATAIAKRHGMTVIFQTARMYRLSRAGKIKLPLERWFGITSFELG